MHFFIDEAGDFSLPTASTDHRVAVATALAFTDTGWSKVQPSYIAFRERLSKRELRSGEPKWNLLTAEHRRDFCDLVHRDHGVSLTPVTLDLSHLVDRGTRWLDAYLNRLGRQPELMVYETAKEQITLLHRQASNLSQAQNLRIYTWAYCLHQALYHAILFLGHGPDQPSWDKIHIEIDAVQRQPRSREELVFRLMVLAWLAGWSTRKPFLTIQGVHTDSHRFVLNYRTEGGIDLGKLVRPNVRWGSSAASDGLQMADLASGAVYEAAAGLGRARSALEMYAYLMGNASYYGPVHGPGLFSPYTHDLDDISAKYDAIYEVMKQQKR